ncbi:MAG: glycosyltransferase [Nanoarchaeota archaeon]|nr:glycosyltransferase [Nanoarchaeota archaeon]
MIYYTLWVISFIGLILGIFWIQLLFFKEGKRIKLKELPFVSIIVPAYNEEKTIEKTIRSLLNLNYPKNKLEIIVVNDESKDNTAGVVKGFKNVKLINNKHKGIGKASAVNAGLRVARGEFFSVLDADSEISKDSLKIVLEHFYNKKVGCVITPVKVLKRRNIYNWLQRIEYTFTVMIRELMTRINTLYYSHGVLSVFRTGLVKKLGYFDENNLTEDLEIAMRLKSNNYEIVMALDALTYTNVPMTFVSLWKQRVRWYRGFLYNLKKYKHIIFNKKYGAYGNFQLPLNIFSISILVLVFLLFSYEILRRIYNFIIKFIILKFEAFSLGEIPSLKFIIFSIDIKYIFPIIIVILLNLYLLYKASRFIQEKRKIFSLTLLMYFIIYPILTMFHWVAAVFQEIFSTKKKW